MARLINLAFEDFSLEQTAGMLFGAVLLAYAFVNRDRVMRKLRERAAEEIRATADLYVPMFDLLLVLMDRAARRVDAPLPRVRAERLPRLVRDLVAERRASLLTVR